MADSRSATAAETVVIIGSGPAGWSAATYAARAQLRPLVFEGAISEKNRMAGTLPLGQLALTSEVENYAGFPAGDLGRFLDSALPSERRMMMPPHEGHGVTGPELMELMRQQAVNFGTRIVTDDIERVHFKNRGVSACAVCDGALPRFRNRPLVVVGGGDSAVEEATYLTKFASTVHLVHRRDTLRASKIMAQRAVDDPKITIHFNQALAEVLGDDARGVTGVRLESTTERGRTTEVEAAGVFLAIGHTPNTAFLDGQHETIQFIETSRDVGPWLRGGAATLRGLAENDLPYLGHDRPFGGCHPGGTYVSRADGSVSFLRDSIDPAVFRAMLTIAGGRDEQPFDAP